MYAVKTYNSSFSVLSNLDKQNLIMLLSDLWLVYREMVAAQYQPTLS